MQRVRSFVLQSTNAEGQHHAITVGENDVTMCVLVAAPDGIYYTAEGETPGRFFIPMHMVRNVLMMPDDS